uniref:Transmembrane protein 254 n=1 Tax=Salvator merianae TaxID=96440 RepID=A0A8D0BC48_SALMN
MRDESIGREVARSRMAVVSASGDGSQRADTYFHLTRPFWMLLILFGMSYYGWAVFSPSTIPYKRIGPLGTFTKFLLENHETAFQIGYLIAWLIHIGEALYAYKLCKSKDITDSSTLTKWVLQTLLFGIASLYYLLIYKPQKKTK